MRCDDRTVPTRPVLLVLDVSDSERADPVYGAVLQTLTRRAGDDARAAGFVPVRLASDAAGVDGVLDALDDADAVLLMGGEDLSPDLYGAAPDYPGAGGWFRDADVAQIAAVRSAVQRRIPVVGICRGMQLANVALGGTLLPHIEAHVRPGSADASMVDHDVTVAAGSALADALGTEKLSVRSSHHQAVDALGEGLAAVAHAPDGVIEAVEHASAPLWAVQWHPEDEGAAGDVLARLLDTAHARVRARSGTRD